MKEQNSDIPYSIYQAPGALFFLVLFWGSEGGGGITCSWSG